MAIKNRWMVICDDERRTFATRAKARQYASWLRHHPSNVDIRLFGPYKNVDGCPRVVDLRHEDPDEEDNPMAFDSF